MTKKEQKFVELVWDFYTREGRHTLPWRNSKNPYRILVSEIMLQQTQVERVLPKYKNFIKQFPTLRILSEASLGDVLREWQGLGYNRRAKMLHQCAQEIMSRHEGIFPRNYRTLIELPGIGPYTAGAIMAFAYNEAEPIIETNIRTVFIHHFFNDDTQIHDQEIVAVSVRCLDRTNPREWYYALMDYGSFLKKTIGNQNTRSLHYTKQSTFRNSDRQIRGAIIRTLSKGPCTRNKLHKVLSFESDRIDAQVERLLEECMIMKHTSTYSLP